ncbi:MAG: 5-deoxy-glucuronate isomerase [Nocardioidaceae bacterium]
MSVPPHVRAGQTARAPYALDITPDAAGWSYSGLAVLEPIAGQSVEIDTGDSELLVMSLEGSCTVTVDEQTLTVAGRPHPFAGASDFVYVPRDTAATITSADGGRFALPSAVCQRALPFRHAAAESVPVELRGAGQASRQVNNFCTPEAFETDKLIACEVLTPGGNWSSYPPHKHDEQRPGESELEEIYYFEVAAGPSGPGFAYQRVYGHDRADIDVLAEVRTGDAVLIPYGWHGPSMAAPGYDLYYLNVMAGPADERAWHICDDPQHAWVRDAWVDQPMDPRLPFGHAGALK